MTRPAARIELDGQDVTDTWGPVLVSVSVTDEAGVKADTCELEFDNRERFTAPPIDAEIKVYLGYEPTPHYMGSYKISTWRKSGPLRTLTVEGRSADLTSAIRAPKRRSFHEVTVKSIVAKIAAGHGLEAIVDADIGAKQIDHIDQQNESDVSFLTRLASRNGATFKLADGKLLFAAKGSRKTPSGKEKEAVTIKPEQCSHWDATCDKRGDYKAASADYMDHDAGVRKTETTGEGTPKHRDRRLYGSQSEAKQAAKAKLDDLTRGQMTVEIDGEGNPLLFAEALVTLEGFDDDVDGDYLAKSVRHTFSRSGYTTSVTLETEGASDAAAG